MAARQPIDPAWWNADYVDGLAMREILTARDIKAVFNFLHRRGWSWSAIAQATDIGEQRVREIAGGKRRVENYDVYVRIAVGLSIPRDYLGVGLRSTSRITQSNAIATVRGAKALSTQPTPAFVSEHTPSTRIPRARAGRTSGTIDMPTTVAPACRACSISLGVS